MPSKDYFALLCLFNGMHPYMIALPWVPPGIYNYIATCCITCITMYILGQQNHFPPGFLPENHHAG